ncbi:MAG: twin-arginine translocase TatA/TatE family subunit [Candidatus Pristimantibacillus sp.]
MSGIGTTGIILLVLVALLLFGPNKLPELGRAFGRTLKEFKSGAKDMMEDDNNKDKDSKRIDVTQADNNDSNNKRLPD